MVNTKIMSPKTLSTAFHSKFSDLLCTNRELDDGSLYLDWRKPFDALAKQAEIKYGVAEEIRTPDLLSHSQTL